MRAQVVVSITNPELFRNFYKTLSLFSESTSNTISSSDLYRYGRIAVRDVYEVALRKQVKVELAKIRKTGTLESSVRITPGGGGRGVVMALRVDAVGVGSRYARIRNLGTQDGPIVPKNREFLTVPTRTNYQMGNGNFPLFRKATDVPKERSFLIHTSTVDTRVLMLKTKDRSIVPIFTYVKSIEQKGSFWADNAIDAVVHDQKLMKAAISAVSKILKGK